MTRDFRFEARRRGDQILLFFVLLLPAFFSTKHILLPTSATNFNLSALLQRD